MTTATELLARLRAADVHVHAENGRLRVNAPKGGMTPELEAALVAGKEELLRVLGGNGHPADAPALAPAPRDGAPLPLSFLQERLWVLDRLQPGLTTYNIATVLVPEGPVDVALAEQAIRRVVERHEILRSRFVLEDGAPVVRVGPGADVPVEVRDVRGWTDEAVRQALGDAPAAAARVPFDLAAEPPVRFVVYRLDGGRAALLVSAHHIALDSWSFALLAQEIQAEYDAAAEGRAPAPAAALQYADFARWQRRTMEHPAAAARLAYWKGRLAGLPQLTVFPPDVRRAADEVGTGATLDFRWPAELYASVRALARESDATVYMVLVAAVAAVLARHTAQTDLALGSPVGTRERAELEGMIGPILNPLVLRLDVADDPTFAELVARAREAVLEGHSHQEVPFERIVHELNPGRSLGHAPLFQVAVVLHNAPNAAAATLTGGGSIYDFTVYANERDGALGGSVEYRSDLYAESTVRRIVGHVERALQAAAGDRALRVSELPLLGAEEYAQVVRGFNATGAEVDRDGVVAQFARAAAARPDAVAVTAADGSLTYAALDRRSAALAARLRALGAGRGRVVALATDRTSALVVAALGILRSGAAYVPVDLAYPAERVAFMLRDSGAEQVVTTRALLPSLPAAHAATAVVVDDVDEGDAAAGDAADAPAPGDIAYLMYTSGSTGTPKGVLVPHGAVSNFLGAMRASVGFTADDVVVAVTSPSFDISVLELFLPLVQGGRTVIASREEASDGAALVRLVAASGATMFQSTPSGWRLLMNAGWEGNPALCAIAGGEPMPADLAEWLRPRVRALWNGYGPTEATVYATAARLDAGEPITIGTPLANTRVYVLDAHGRPAPIGGVGELCVAGDGVALGYHARPELTAERFVPDLVDAGATMYRTGDVARWRADGRLEHLGRADGQVKVRGYRIETGEIEAAIATHDSVRAAVVDVRSAAADDPRIVAWVQLHEDEECTPSELRRHLRRRLPEFMIPSMVVPVEQFPLTPNGKVDRRALPDAFVAARPASADVARPTTPTERLIADVWARLLGVDRIGVADTFFDLGGHSLLAMRAATEITARTGREIEPRLLFFRTLGQLAEACDAPGGRRA